MANHEATSRIAVVGVAALFPGSINRDGFWRDILAGRDLITDVPDTHWLIEDYYDPDPRARDKTYAKRGAFLPEVDFDAMAWGVPPTNLAATDTTQLLALVVAQQVLEDACGGQFTEMSRERVSVILGVTSAQELLGSMVSRLQHPIWAKALREQGLSEAAVTEACDRIASHYVEWQESTFPGVLGNVVAGRIANRLDLGGTNCVTDAACASSFSALSMAVGELRLGHSDLVICGGADTMNDIFMYVCFSKTPALSPTGDCRPFSDGADGTLLGEGIGMFALKRLADAERDGDRIYAVIAGVGASSDGRSKSVYAPVPAGQARALRRAYDAAGYGPDTVELVEAHGTGTRAGDAAEFAGLRQVFDESGRADRNWCALGSVKSQIGHTKAAAGAAGLFKAVMALTHGVVPPTIKVDRPDPKLEIETSAFYLNTAARPWFRDARHPRRASVSSFGFGGSNFHVTLEEYTGPARRAQRVRPAGGEMVLLSDASAAAIAARCSELARDAARDGMLQYLARSTQESFEAGAPARLGVFAESDRDLEAKLTKATDLLRIGRDFAMPGGIEFVTTPPTSEVAFLFPGQGSQYLNMGADLCMAFEAARAIWEAAPAMHDVSGSLRLHDVVFPRPAFDDAERDRQRARLTATEWAQPAIGAASLAQLEVLRLLGVQPCATAGHSFGELTGLCAAGVMSSADFFAAARRRGELMAEAARTPGAMLSVAGQTTEVEACVATWDLDVVIANYNTPSQVVLSGTVQAIGEAEKRLGELGVVMNRLPVSTAFHSRIVEPACAPFRAFVAGIEIRKQNGVDVYSCTSASPYPSAPDAMRDVLAAQIAQPVRFVEQIEAMYARGIRVFVEVGPGNVLTNLAGHILKNRPHRVIALDRKGRQGLASFNEGLGQLSLAGVPLAYDRLWSAFASVPDPRTAQPAGMVVRLSGAGYGKPYPPRRTAAPARANGRPPVKHVSEPSFVEPAATPRRPPVAAAATEADVRAIPQPQPRTPMPVTVPAAPAASSAATPPAAAVPAPPIPQASAAVEVAWVQAFQESQRQTAESHATFQRAMAETHAAFLRSSEVSLANLVTLLRGGSAAALSAPASVAPSPVPQYTAEILPVIPAPPPPALPLAAAVTAPDDMEPPPWEPAPIAAFAPATEAPAGTAPLGPTTEPGAAPVAADLQAVMLRVLADRTGYPEEMLSLDMDLEADLGVDSIKRVEILSAVQDHVPNLPVVRPAQLASRRTLREIVAFFVTAGGSTQEPAVHATPAVAAPQASGEKIAATSTSRMPMSADTSRALTRSILRAVETPAVGLGLPGILGPGHFVVTDDEAGVADALAARLRAAGVRASVQREVPADAAAVILLYGLRADTGFHEAMAVNRAAFAAARAVAPRFAVDGGIFVTVQDTGGDFGLHGSERAWLGGIAALAKTAALEWTAAQVRALDIERGSRTADEVAEALWNELLAGGCEREVGLRADGSRIAIASRPAALDGEAREPAPIPDDSVVVASGGGRGVTAACLVALAASARCRFLVLGRTPLVDEPESCAALHDEADLKRALLADMRRQGHEPRPADLGRAVAGIRAVREIRGTLNAITAAGGKARYEALDVTDVAAVSALIGEVRATWGRIHGMVHGAGVLADKLIADKTDAQFDLVFGTKVAGLHALLEATRQDDLSFIVLFSSIAARAGNPGQVDYAMGNEVLNKIAALEQRRRGSRCLVRALGWGPWDGGMVDDGLRRHFAEQRVPLIPVAAGVQQFRAELAARADGPVEILLVASGHADVAKARNAGSSYDVLVDRARYPFLDGHCVKGEPVVPVALVLEWFARAVHAHCPDRPAFTFRRLQVLRGIRLSTLDRGLQLVVRVRHSNGSGGDLSLEIVGSAGHRHYSAEAELSPIEERRATVAPGPGTPWSGQVYGQDGLFHGPSFQVLRDIEVSTRGMVASVSGVNELGWPGPWLLDPAWLDGGLQLALLWTRRKLGGASLPTAIDTVHVHPAAAARGRVRCILQDGETRAGHMSTDLVFIDEDERTVAELRGVMTHLLPETQDPAGVSASW